MILHTIFLTIVDFLSKTFLELFGNVYFISVDDQAGYFLALVSKRYVRFIQIN